MLTEHSYFSSLFAATRTFPRHPGIASGLSMGLLGLSPLLFSLVAGNLFNVGDDELDVSGYTRFLAIYTLIIHLIGAFTLDVNHPKKRERIEGIDDADEETPLVRSVISLSDPQTSLRGVLNDSSFWLLGFIVAMTLGSVFTLEYFKFFELTDHSEERNGDCQRRLHSACSAFKKHFFRLFYWDHSPAGPNTCHLEYLLAFTCWLGSRLDVTNQSSVSR